MRGYDPTSAKGMVYYLIPESASRSELKLSYQFVQLLDSLGVRIAAASPGGKAPGDFLTRAAIVSREDLLSRGGCRVIRTPYDDGLAAEMDKPVAEHLVRAGSALPNQGTPRWSPVPLPDTLNVGLHVAPHYYFDGRHKFEDVVAIDEHVLASQPAWQDAGTLAEFLALGDQHDLDIARLLQSAGIYVSTERDWAHRLRALEAQAAGCVVLALGAINDTFLKHGQTCWRAEPDDGPTALAWLLDHRQRKLCCDLRNRARAVSESFSPARHRRDLARLLQAELRVLVE